jgi:hypothetical protein
VGQVVVRDLEQGLRDAGCIGDAAAVGGDAEEEGVEGGVVVEAQGRPLRASSAPPMLLGMRWAPWMRRGVVMSQRAHLAP